MACSLYLDPIEVYHNRIDCGKHGHRTGLPERGVFHGVTVVSEVADMRIRMRPAKVVELGKARARGVSPKLIETAKLSVQISECHGSRRHANSGLGRLPTKRTGDGT